MKNLTLCLVLIVNFFAFSQDLYITNNTNLQPIKNAKVELVLKGLTTKTFNSNAKGLVELTGVLEAESNSVMVFISANNYADKLISYADLKSLNFKVSLFEKMNELDEVVVSANKFEEKKGDVSQKIQVLSATELENMNQTSMADVLSNSGNVMVQKSQLGGGSPIIRGFETNRVLMVVDGVRLNNAIYRGGHLQNIITMDNATMDRVEIVYGPGSVIYGSDALGGVMHFYTKNPQLSTTDKALVTGSAFGRFTSANSGTAEHVDISVAGKRFGSLTSFTYSDFGDLRQGAVRNPFYSTFGNRSFYVDRVDGKDSAFVNLDTNLQVKSGYSQVDFLQKFTYIQNENVEHRLNFQYSTSSDIPRYDRLTQVSGGKPKFAEWYYGPQERLFASYTLLLTGKTLLYDEARIILGYQGIEESRNDRRFQKNFLNQQIENVSVYSLNADFEKRIGKHEIRYGVEGYYNDVKSRAFTEDIVADTTAPISTRYPDGGSKMQSAAIYVTDAFELNEKLILNAGVRGTYVGLGANFVDQTFFPFPYSSINQSNVALNGNVGLVYRPTKDWRFTLLGSTGFRAPNVDDLTKVFDSQPGNVIVPNPSLKPEYIYNGEVGVSKTFYNRITISATGYASFLENALTVQKGQFNGQDSILYKGQLSQVTTTTNSAQAYVYGFEGGISGNLTERLSIFGTLNHTYGRIVTDTTDQPLDHIPPTFGKMGFSFKINKFRADVFSLFSGWKRVKDYNMLGEDNFANATALGMPAWYTLNLRMNYQFSKYIGLQLACENILDQNYRVFASNISSPGRNFMATLRVNF
ncbi:MAG: TonB-dependent receptor [Bacteroidetes bacterium]|nr:TonB-dependent receptor [Bacteroidota bacterium]